MQTRYNVLQKWLATQLPEGSFQLKPLAGDASFRRYYRLITTNQTYVVMDAPPPQEALGPFLSIAGLLRELGLRTPSIQAADQTLGFALLEDFGDCLFLSALNNENANQLYLTAIDQLILMQRCPLEQMATLPPFNRTKLEQELALFADWFLTAYLKLQLTSAEKQMLDQGLEWITFQVEKMPRVLTHRDYHSRNLMLLKPSFPLGVIDFQDAAQGPLAYDLVSLLKDCYIQWPIHNVKQWTHYFYSQSFIAQQESFSDFERAFELCGIQRHLKVLGIFSRLHLRDNKPNYLKDLPLTLHYLLAALEGFSELKQLYEFMQERIRLP